MNYKELFDMDCPYIIKIHEIVEVPEGPIFIQEFLDTDIKTYSIKTGYMGYNNLAELFLQMGKALVFLKVT